MHFGLKARLNVFNKKKKCLLFLAFGFCLINACSLNNDEVRNIYWKHKDGRGFGDFLNLNDKNNLLKNDTIFSNDTAKAVIIKAYDRLNADEVLMIKFIDRADTGWYVGKGSLME